MIPHSSEHRKFSRQILHIPVQLEIDSVESAGKKTVLGYTADYSRKGLQLLLPQENSIPHNSTVTVYWPNQNLSGALPEKNLKIPGKVVWQNNGHCGVQFQEQAFKEPVFFPEFFLQEVQEPLLSFSLLVNGQDMRSSKHEYVPYARQSVTNPERVKECLYQIKHGKMPLNVQDHIYARYPIAASELCAQAVDSAQKAFNEFKKFSMQARRRQLQRCHEYLLKEKQKLLHLWIVEGYSLSLALWQFDNIAAILSEKNLHALQNLMCSPGGFAAPAVQSVALHRPLGVHCIWAEMDPFDSVGLACLALLGGNTLVIAPGKRAPLSTLYLWKEIFARGLAQEGAPAGVVNVVAAPSAQLLTDWTHHPDVQRIFATHAFVAHRPRPVSAASLKKVVRVNTSDVVCIWKDADLEAAAQSLLDAFLGLSQFLHVPKKALIHEDVYQDFMKIFIAKVKALSPGLPQDPQTLFAPVEKIAEFFDYLDDAIANGANVLTGAWRQDYKGQRDESGPYVAPTVIECPLHKAAQIRCVQNEPFFPLLPVFRVAAPAAAGSTASQGTTNASAPHAETTAAQTSQDAREKDRFIFESMEKFLSYNQPSLRLSVWVKNPLYLHRFIEEVHYARSLRFNQAHSSFSRRKNDPGFDQTLQEFYPFWLKTSALQNIFGPTEKSLE